MQKTSSNPVSDMAEGLFEFAKNNQAEIFLELKVMGKTLKVEIQDGVWFDKI
jgi:hypothetical protein